jgi:hypothetical protein
VSLIVNKPEAKTKERVMCNRWNGIRCIQPFRYTRIIHERHSHEWAICCLCIDVSNVAVSVRNFDTTASVCARLAAHYTCCWFSYCVVPLQTTVATYCPPLLTQVMSVWCKSHQMAVTTSCSMPAERAQCHLLSFRRNWQKSSSFS